MAKNNSDTSSDPADEAAASANAADLIRRKINRIYEGEPDADKELIESESEPSRERSKHQEFMHSLGASGKDLATIQTEWHNYYQSLSDEEKHEVWQEFYASQSALTHPKPSAAALAEHKHQAAGSRTERKKPRAKDSRSKTEVQSAIRDKVSKRQTKLTAKQNLQSLLFGLSIGLITVIIFLFGFFNEVFIAPFIQPSRASAATPIIIGTDQIAPTATPEVIIPKINVEIPVNYKEASTDENAIEGDLQDGVVHYPTTVLPGQTGNAAFFGHSSNNIFNQGKYKFAFVLLHTLVPGDTFYLTSAGKVYVYKVISRTIVDPSDVGVLGPVAGQTATATLITCDPPGTSLHRLIVVGQQVSPDPSTNVAGNQTPVAQTTKTTSLPGNGPTLFTRFFSTAIGKIALAGVVVIAAAWVIRRSQKILKPGR